MPRADGKREIKDRDGGVSCTWQPCELKAQHELNRRMFTQRSQETKQSIKLISRKKRNHKTYASWQEEKGVFTSLGDTEFSHALSVSQYKAKTYDAPCSRLSV